MNINYFQKFLLILSFFIMTLVAMEDDKAIIPTKPFIPTANTPQANAELLEIVKTAFMDFNGNWTPKTYFFEETLQEIETCLKQNADPNSKFGFDKTPLFSLAVRHQIKDLCNLLLRYGANINAYDIYKRTPLHILIYNFKDNPDIVNIEYLLQNRANANAKTENLTPLSQAIWYQHLGYVKHLIKYCANVTRNNDVQNTDISLKYAIHNSDSEAIKILCNAGAPAINVDNYNHPHTVFHLAIYKSEEIIKTLMTHIKFKNNDDNIKNTIKTTLLVFNRLRHPLKFEPQENSIKIPILPSEIQIIILSKLLSPTFFHTGLYKQCKENDCQQLPLKLLNEHVQLLNQILQMKNCYNQTALELIQKTQNFPMVNAILNMHGTKTKTGTKLLLEGTALQKDLDILKKVYPDLSSVPKENLALQILENHYNHQNQEQSNV